MPDLLFPAPDWPLIPVAGRAALFPVRRVFCVGRNYAEHAVEMGHEVDRSAPFYFTKSAPSVAVANGELTIPYPPGTSDYQHEVELVVAIGASGFRVTPEDAGSLVWGYGCGLDMTRRDLQAQAKEKGRPWSLGKDAEGSAVIGPLTPAEDWPGPAAQQITLAVNGVLRQRGELSDMIWSVPELVADLSRFFHLSPGDLILSGTPAGVGPVVPGDRITAGIRGLTPLTVTIGAPA